jgi:hypothetical protein
MAQTAASSAKQAGKTVLAEAKHDATSPLMKWLERLGFLTRGLIYVVIGVLALQLAAGAGGGTASPTSAIAVIGRQPYGKVFLAVIVVGLVGYALWGVVRAVLDPLGRGSDPKGLFDRAGFLFSGLTYALLLIPTVAALMNKPSTSQGSASGLPAGLTSGATGHWVTVAFGFIWIAIGVGQLAAAYTAHFMRDLKTSEMSAQEVQTATWLGKAGYAARGVVFAVIGLIILQAELAGGAQPAKGIDGALAALAHAPYGTIVLGVVALGLILFGLYSGMCAKWTRIGARR